MVQMKRTAATAAAVATALALLMTGCSAGNPTSVTPTGNVTWNAPTHKLSGVTLTFWSATQTADMLKQPIAAFEKATGAQIKTVVIPDVYETNAPTKIATGSKPDLATWQPTGSMLALLQPATNLQSLDDAPWISKLTPAIQKLGSYKGHRYSAYIKNPSVLGVFYNKADFAKAGITSTPKNWGGMIADAHKLKDIGIAPFFGAAGDQWPLQWIPQEYLADAGQAGLWTKVNQNKEKFTGATIQSGVEQLQSMAQDGLFNKDYLTSTYNETGPALLNGTSAMAIQMVMTALLKTTASTAEINSKLGWFPISKDGNLASVNPGGDNALVAFRTGDKVKEAATRQFLNFLLTTDYKKFVEDQGTVSIEPSVATPSSVPQVEIDADAAIAHSVGDMQAQAVANPDFYVYLADMVQGKKTPMQVGEATQSQFAQIAKAEGIAGF